MASTNATVMIRISTNLLVILLILLPLFNNPPFSPFFGIVLIIITQVQVYDT